MLDFEDAAKRLAKDQSKLRNNRRTPIVSAKAQREVEFRRKQQAKLREQRQEQQRQLKHQLDHILTRERQLKVKSLTNGGLLLQPTSIWGEGDKIALPPSVLERLTSADDHAGGNPWIFRIGILNPDYKAPMSPLLTELKPPKYDDHMDDDEYDDENDGSREDIYMDEMAFKYLSYTHCTVVEFTQEEGQVGIPQPIATALLNPLRRRPEFRGKEIAVTRTIDPAGTNVEVIEDDAAIELATNGDQPDDMEVENADKTPGHLAWGAFDVPDTQLEITMVTLPKGKACTLTPTPDAIRNNFYALKDIKMVLEQSLIRTRATLAIHDVVHTWHRGIKYDMTVDKVSPSAFDAITCINTDIEVDIGETSMPETAAASTAPAESETVTQGRTLGTGRQLGSSTSATVASSAAPAHNLNKPAAATTKESELRSEPPADQKEGVCTIQLRSASGTGRRRFDVEQATVHDLFAFALSVHASDPTLFQLVTRFPRRVVTWNDETSARQQTLSELGISQGQELFMLEPRS